MKTFYTQSHAAFAAYFNMARQNVKIILESLEKAVGVNEQIDESALFQLKVVTIEKGFKPEIQDFLYKRLLHHFPFLKVILQNQLHDTQKKSDTNKKGNKKKEPVNVSLEEIKYINPIEVSNVLIDFLKVLNVERNHASHYMYNEKETKESKEHKDYLKSERKVAKYLNYCLLSAVQKTPEIFKINENKLNFIATKSEKGVALKPDFQLADEDGLLTDMGRVFLISMLIEKRHLAGFLDSIEGFYSCCPKGKDIEEKKKNLRSVFSLLHIRKAKGRLDSEENTIQLALDMLNELKKCPKELYDHIHPDNQKKFEFYDKDGEGYQTLLMRYHDRFPEFALRYIDKLNIFSTIRFQTNIGKYRYCFKEDKHCADGETRMRVLQKEINCFSRFEDAEFYRLNSLKNIQKDGRCLFMDYESPKVDDLKDFPYITDSRTHYLLDGDQLCMTWIDAKNINNDFIKDHGNVYPKIDIENNVVPALMPLCFMSVYEIPAMVFHSFLYANEKGKSPETEKIIQDCTKKYLALFSDIVNDSVMKVKCADRKEPKAEEYRHIEETYSIKWKDIPDKIRDYLVGRTRPGFEKFAESRIESMIEKTTYRLECIEKDIAKIPTRKNMVGSRSFAEIQTGKLANYLIKDIVMFQPSTQRGDDEGKDKVTGLNYRVLQASIALFDARRGKQNLDEFVRMFRSVGLIGSENPHPFLESVLNQQPMNTLEFYKYYLEAKLKELKKILKKKSYHEVYFLHGERSRWQIRNKVYYQELAQRYLNQPINLPRGLFEESIRLKLTELAGKDSRLVGFADQLTNSNVAYMITGYFNVMKLDANQNFYDYKRNYRLMDLLYDETKYFKPAEFREHKFKEEIENHVDCLQVMDRRTRRNRKATNEEREVEKRRLRHNLQEYDKNEKSIRRHKTEDFLLMQMAKNILASFMTHSKDSQRFDTFRLKDVRPDGDVGILEQALPFSMTIVLDDGQKKKISQKEVKIKNYGEFFAMLYDERIKTLLPYVQSNEIDKTVLEEELVNYDTSRVEVYRQILKLEKKVLNCYNELKEEPEVGFRKIIYRPFEESSDDRLEYIIEVRNSFGHNHYPADNSLMEYDLPEVILHVRSDFEKALQRVNSNIKK